MKYRVFDHHRKEIFGRYETRQEAEEAASIDWTGDLEVQRCTRIPEQGNLHQVNGSWCHSDARKQLGKELVTDDGETLHCFAVGPIILGVRVIYLRSETGEKYVSMGPRYQLEDVSSASMDTFQKSLNEGHD